MSRIALSLAILATLAACSPRDMADQMGRRTAETVVRPIIDDTMTEPQALGVTRCIVSNATPAEISSLLRDVGVYAGSSTTLTVAGIAARPETLACIRGSGLPVPSLPEPALLPQGGI
jgi:ABC-type amino acid transport substrate-binding protein